MKNNKILIGVLIFLSVLFVVILILFLNKPNYEVQFVSDNMIIDTVKVKRKKLVDRPTNPVKEGYIFVDWYLNGNVYDFSSPITENIVLTALWKAQVVEDDEFVITFNTNGGNILSPIKIKKNEKITKPSDPSKEGYKFLGWYYKLDNNEKEFDFDTAIVENIELYAKWEKVEPVKSSSSSSSKKNDSTKSYTVKFETDGGSKVPSQTVKENGKATKPNNPTKEGYKFREWRLNNGVYDFNAKVTKNITLTAIWTKSTVDVNSIQLSCSTLNMIVGNIETISAVVSPTNATDKSVIWTTSNRDIATVNSSGMVTAINVGTATITASAGGKNATCTVTVTQVPASSSTEPSTSSEPEIPPVTYSVRWEEISNSDTNQYKVYIVDSNGETVSGRIRIYFNSSTGVSGSIEVDVPNNEFYPSSVYDITRGDVLSHN